MANKKLTQLNAGVLPVDTDLFFTSQDVATVPVSKKITGTQLKAYIGTVGVDGPVSSTDTAIARWNGVLGDSLLNSGVLIDGSDNLSGITNITLSGTIDTGQGATELYAMDQNVRITDDVDFNSVTFPTTGGTPAALDFYEEFSYVATFDFDTDVWTLSQTVTLVFTRIGNKVTMQMDGNLVGITNGVPTDQIILWSGSLVPVRFRPRTFMSQMGRSLINFASVDEAGTFEILTSGQITFRKNASSPNWPASTNNSGFAAGSWSWLTT